MPQLSAAHAFVFCTYKRLFLNRAHRDGKVTIEGEIMKNAKDLLNKNFDELVSTLQNVVHFNTEKGVAAHGAPFGVSVKACLDYVLGVAKDMGFATYNCDGYAGHVDFKGSGDETLGVLGHLDVVPAIADEWKYPPYEAVIADGKLYGRGTMDDKGPMIACLFAIKALKDAGFRPTKTIRLIFGCDEESGMECVEHYFTKMPYPTVSFSPDGDFPVINREKGIYQFDIACGKLPCGVSIVAGDRANVVPSLCVAKVPACDLKDDKVYANSGVTVTKDGDVATLTAEGKAAHGSTPDEGINATHKVLRALAAMYPDNATIAFAASKLLDTTGKAWGVALHDEHSGNLTCNLGVLRTTSEGKLNITVDIRFPVSFRCDDMYKLLRDNTPAEFDIVPGHTSEPLFVPGDSQLVTTLIDVYNKAMGTALEPIAIGGGTYSRCLPNCVAFGPLFPGEEQTIHMPDELVILSNLRKMAEIYVEAIYELAK